MSSSTAGPTDAAICATITACSVEAIESVPLSALVAPARLGSARLGSARLGSAQLSSTSMIILKLSFARSDPTRQESVMLRCENDDKDEDEDEDEVSRE